MTREGVNNLYRLLNKRRLRRKKNKEVKVLRGDDVSGHELSLVTRAPDMRACP